MWNTIYPQNRVRAAYYRGGTSRAIFFRKQDLPKDEHAWQKLFAYALGSPDHNERQLDGLGTGITSCSKIAVINLSSRDDADVDYKFIQVGIKDGELDYSSNSGNIAAAVGPFVVDSDMIPETRDGAGSNDIKMSVVRILNTNTNKIIHSTFPSTRGEAITEGDFAIAGVPGTGAKIKLDFLDLSGSRTGKLLPTGSVTNKFDGIQTTCIDVGNPIVFVQADDLGIDGAILPHELIKHHTDVLQRLETIRYQTAIGIGIANEDMKTLPKSVPKICMVSRLKRYFLLSGEEVEQSSVDLVVRPISQESQSHRTCQITVALGAAAEMRDLVMKNMLSHGRVVNDSLTIGHPSGTMVVSAKFINQAGSTEIVLDHVTVFRTARRIMDGEPYWNLREEIQN